MTVGDGDLSFSLALARRMRAETSTLVATCYESRETVLKVYPNAAKTIQELESLPSVMLGFQVDATALVETLPKKSKELQFNRIVWNFPCSAVPDGQDGQNDEMEHNKILIRQFLENASKILLRPNGDIYICHKTKPPFNHWQIETLAINVENLQFHGRIVFDRCTFVPYVPRKALDKSSFPSHDACFYVYGRKSGSSLKQQSVDWDDDKLDLNSDLIRVNKGLVLKIRQMMLLGHNKDNKKKRKKQKRYHGTPKGNHCLP